MNTSTLRIFTPSYLQYLRSAVFSDPSVLATYKLAEAQYDAVGIADTRLKVANQAPGLEPTADADADNAIKIYEYYSELNESLAVDERIWSYATHITFRDYMINRWAINATKSEILNEADIFAKSSSSVADHWFYGQRGMVRNGIARLWWGAQATIAPWENGDAEFYSDLDTTDRFRYTRLLFSKAVIYQQIMERETTRSPRIKATLFEHIHDNQNITKESIGEIAKKIDMVKSYRKLETMDYVDLRRMIDGFSKKH